MKKSIMELGQCLLLTGILSFNSYAQYSSISIQGSDILKPGTTNSYKCYANYSYGGTPTIILDATWEIIDMNPKYMSSSAYLNWEFSSIKVSDFVIGEFEFTLKCSYQSFTITKRITVHPSPPTLTEAKNAYVVWIPTRIKDDTILEEFAGHALSDLGFKGIIEIGLGVTSKLVTKLGGFFISFLTMIPSAGSPTIFDLSLSKNGNETNILNVIAGEEFSYRLNFSKGTYLTWSYGVKLEVHKQRGPDNYVNTQMGFDYYSEIEVLTEDESIALPSSNNIIYPKKGLKFSEPGVYRIRVWNEADSGTRVVYVQVTGDSISKSDILLGFILDSSGSMTTTDPYDIRKSGVKQIIGLLDGTEKVFIVDFDSRATWLNSNNYKGWNKYQLQSEIDRIDSDGGTNIGTGISRMQNALQNELNPGSKAGVILLTDGDGDYNNEAHWFSSMNIPIFTISYKDNAVSTLMNEIANVTNGQYIKANNEGDIVSAFTQFYNEILGNSKFLSYYNTITMGETITHPGFFIEPGCSMINGNLSYLGSKISLSLLTPGGVQISEGDSNAEWIIGSNYSSVKINNPESGRWTAIFNGVDIPPNGEPFVFEVNGSAPNTIRLVDNTIQGGPISFSLLKEKGRIDISRLDAEVEVLTPQNNLLDITENFSDGNVRYLPLEGTGDYQFWINISGKDNSGNSIQRHFKKSVLVGDFVPFYIGEVTDVMGSIIKAKLGTNVGNRAGLKCYVYNTGKNTNEKNAIGYVTFVSDDECTIEIQQYFESQFIKAGDIVELDSTHWLSDSY